MQTDFKGKLKRVDTSDRPGPGVDVVLTVDCGKIECRLTMVDFSSELPYIFEKYIGGKVTIEAEEITRMVIP